MARSFERLLVQADDHELCNGMRSRILAFHGNDLDATDIDEPERVVLLVWHVSGIVGNGGFRYLFEGHLPGDPYFARTSESFEAIGCKKAATAIRKALSIFPDSMPHRNIDERLRFYLRRVKGTPTDIDRMFFEASDDVTKCLADYIRARRDDFRHLKDVNPDGDDWREPKPSPQMRRKNPKRVSTIDDLPHWARVAFAARCARRVLPLWTRSWPRSPEEHPNAVRLAIELAEQSAAEGRAAEGLDSAIMHAVMAAGAALMGDAYGLISEPPENALAGTIAASVAKVAEHAAKAARTLDDQSLLSTLQALSFAADAAADETEILNDIREDFERLFRVAKRSQWKDRTKVPTEIWSML